MRDLIEALTIFLKYGNPYNPTHCEHNVLNVGIAHADVSQEDRDRLEELSFTKDEYGMFSSYRFGSA